MPASHLTNTASAPSTTPVRTFKASPEAVADAERDAALVRRFVAGDESAFLEIMEHYRQKLYGLALNFLKNPCDAEEIVQDTFVRAHRSLPRFRGDSSLATWLYRITVNLARNRYWYLFRRRRQDSLSLDRAVGEDGAATFAELLAADRHDPAQETVTGEFASLVAEAMERLDEGHREILTMRNLLNLSYEEIANSLGIHVGTVKSRISRARERLRALINDACPEFTADADPADYFIPRRHTYGAPTIAYA